MKLLRGADNIDSGPRGRHTRRRPAAAARAQRLCLAALAIFLITAAASAPYAATVTEHLDIGCVQQPVELLRCEYRLRQGDTLNSSIAEYGGKVIEGVVSDPFPRAGQFTDLLLLVDTSDPARQPVIEKIIAQIGDFLALAEEHHRFGLASFDTDLFLLADVGSTHADIRQAAATLRAKGKTTELYRNVLDAIRLLDKGDASRKAIVIFSDGLAEDYAYHHNDVVRLAREKGVTIHSIGYPRSVAKSVALQTLRRVSDETGGIYTQTDHVSYAAPGGIFKRIIAAMDSGGALEFDLKPLLAADFGGAIDLSLAFRTPSQSFIVLAPIRLPGAASAAQETVPAATTPLPAERLAPPPSTTAPAPPPLRPARTVGAGPGWLWFAALAVVIVIVMGGVVVAMKRMRRDISEQSSGMDSAVKPIAWLVMHDENDTREGIERTPWRIGRGRNNDLTISDHSVSRLHAEIRSNDEGQLILNDLESLNGVFVNDNRIETIQLREGDLVEIGDVRMHFTLHDESYATEEPTVMVRTRTPV